MTRVIHDPRQEPRLLSGWGRTGATAAMVEEPASVADVTAMLASPTARGAIARGLGRSYGDAAQNAGGRVIATLRLDRILEIDPERGRVRVEAGVSIEQVNRAVLPFGWIVAAVPGTGQVTVGGAIAADVHGKNHRRDGGFCSHIESIELATTDGETVTIGHDHDRDAFLATAGGMGLTGIVTSATLRLQAVESAFVRVATRRADDLEAVTAQLRASASRHVVAWLDLTTTGRGLGQGIVSVADHAARSGLPLRERRDPYRLPARPALPTRAPGGLIRHTTIHALNELRLAAARSDMTRIVPVEAFLHPLDRLGSWSRLFGTAGLVEHHVVIPDHRVDALLGIVGTIASRRAPAALAALKLLGAGRGLLSFPIPGWSLAVDYPAAWPDLAHLLDDLDEQVAAAGGRVYLAKDSRLRRDLLPVMYPELERWRSIQRRLDPSRQLRSDLDRRLTLTG